MTELLALWNRSLSLGSPESSQLYVSSHLAEIVLKAGLSYWDSSGRPPGLNDQTIFVGVAPYDVKDIQLLDTVCERLSRIKDKCGEVVVFSLSDTFTIEELRRVVPDIYDSGSQNPFIALWRAGTCHTTAAGWIARRLIEDLSK